MNVCGEYLPDLPWPDVTNGIPCCEGNAYRGPASCTCWQAAYDLEQTAPRTEADAGVMPKMCTDCAYRPGSPERQNDPTVVASARLLDDAVTAGIPFWCHNGLRRITHYVHPIGAIYVPEIDLASAFTPPIIDGRPYKADGSPADYCAGWTARRLKEMSH